jgi:hypothetical protein
MEQGMLLPRREWLRVVLVVFEKFGLPCLLSVCFAFVLRSLIDIRERLQ